MQGQRVPFFNPAVPPGIIKISPVGYIREPLRTDRSEGVGEAGAGPARGRRGRAQARGVPRVRHPPEHLHWLQAARCWLHYDTADCSCGSYSHLIFMSNGLPSLWGHY